MSPMTRLKITAINGQTKNTSAGRKKIVCVIAKAFERETRVTKHFERQNWLKNTHTHSSSSERIVHQAHSETHTHTHTQVSVSFTALLFVLNVVKLLYITNTLHAHGQ